MLAIRLPSEVEGRLEALAKKTGRTKTYYARLAILEYLNDIEDMHLGEKCLGQYFAGKSKTRTLAEVERALSLAD